MCGICGIVDLSGRGIDRDAVLRMREGVAHRGPDDAGLYVDERVGLGHRRLSIIDLSEAGRQPLGNEDGTIWVMCNGEIYNHRELRAQLEAAGHHFRSHSDSEVLVHGYEEWGLEDTLPRVRGMFAFALWDGRLETLTLVRDRLGVKPLFYAEVAGKLLFASEAAVLYNHVVVTPETLDRGALDFLLAFGYVPPDRCLVQGIRKLPPAHVLRYDRAGIKLWRYWKVRFRPSRQNGLAEELDELDRRLQEAVARRLESDVPLGCFLSGGIDSGLVTALAARRSSEPLRTFTVGFTGAAPEVDERPLARLVAERYGTRHEELLVEPRARRVLPRIVWHCGEPFADVSVIPTYLICQAARDSITVALTGDGGDESFAGYQNVHAAYLAQGLKRWLPHGLRQGLRRVAGGLTGVLASVPAARRFNTLLTYATRSPSQHYDLGNHWNAAFRRHLYDPRWINGAEAQDPLDVVSHYLGEASDLEEAEQLLYTDLHLRLPGDYLTKVDVASNLVALEVRSPFLDHDLVEYAAGLPVSAKLLRWRQKGLLRRLARRYLPTPVVDHPKMGFGPPIAHWLREEWAPLVRELVGKSLAARPGLFNPQVVHSVVEEHLSGRRNHAQRLWSLLCLELWWRLFVDRSMGPGDEL